jgi:hypothetical protein
MVVREEMRRFNPDATLEDLDLTVRRVAEAFPRWVPRESRQ